MWTARVFTLYPEIFLTVKEEFMSLFFLAIHTPSKNWILSLLPSTILTPTLRVSRILGEAQIMPMPKPGNNPNKAIPKKDRKKDGKEEPKKEAPKQEAKKEEPKKEAPKQEAKKEEKKEEKK